MAHFLLIPVGSSGDVHPYIGIGRGLLARGHDATVLTAAPFRDACERVGLGFIPTQSQEDFDEITKNPDLWHSQRGLTLVLHTLARFMRSDYDKIASAYEPGRTVIVGHPIAFSARVFEETSHCPAATIHLAPSIFRTNYQLPVQVPGVDLSFLPMWMKKAMWRAVDRWIIDPGIVLEFNLWRSELGLPPVSRVFKDWVHSPQRVIGLFPAWFAPTQPDWPPQTRLTGFPLYDEPDQALSPGLQRFLDAGGPPILFTPGSANRMGARFFAAALDASRRLGYRALFLTKYPEQLPPSTGDDVWHEPYVPFSLVLERCAAIVHHGGIGTCAQGLAAGVPQIVMPLGFDQPDNAARLVRLGVGGWVRPEQFTGKRVAAALKPLLTDSKVAEQCRLWSATVRATRPIDDTCALLEALIP